MFHFRLVLWSSVLTEQLESEVIERNIPLLVACAGATTVWSFNARQDFERVSEEAHRRGLLAWEVKSAA